MNPRHTKPAGCEWSELVIGPGFLSFTPCPRCLVIHRSPDVPPRIRKVRSTGELFDLLSRDD